jgi:hypothetical protein
LPILAWLTGQVPLPPRVGRVLSGQTLGDGQILPVLSHGAVQVPLYLQNVADVVVADREVPLPVRVGRVLSRQALSDRQTFPVLRQGAVQVPLGNEKIAELVE